MKDTSLHEIRCQNKRWKGNTDNLMCNTLCGRVSSISMGEFWCRKCKVSIRYVVNEDGEVTYFEGEESHARKGGKETPEDQLLALING